MALLFIHEEADIIEEITDAIVESFRCLREKWLQLLVLFHQTQLAHQVIDVLEEFELG